MPPPLPPLCAAKYKAERLLGEGGCGAVWLATQTGLDRKVAIKLIRADVATSGSEGQRSVERFVAEARLTARLAHPAIVTVLDHGVEDGVPWIAYEYVPGRSLADVLAGGPLPWASACAVAMQVAAALHVAHQNDIVHRDVKPENVLYAGEHVKLADFGIAKWTAGESVKTRTGMILGTITHLAPELVKGEPAGPPSDQYALAITLYQMLTGAAPFRGANVAALLGAHLQTAPEPPSKHNPEVPAALDELVLRGLAKEPADRYATMAAFADAVGEVLATSGAGPAPAAPPVRAPSGSYDRSRSGTRAISRALSSGTSVVARPEASGAPRAAAALAVAAAISFGLGAAFLGMRRPPPVPLPSPTVTATPPAAAPDAGPSAFQRARDSYRVSAAAFLAAPSPSRKKEASETYRRASARALRDMGNLLRQLPGEPAAGRSVLEDTVAAIDQVLEDCVQPMVDPGVEKDFAELKLAAEDAARSEDPYLRWLARAVRNRVVELTKGDLMVDTTSREYFELARGIKGLGPWSASAAGLRWRAWTYQTVARLSKRAELFRADVEQANAEAAVAALGDVCVEASALLGRGARDEERRHVERVIECAVKLAARLSNPKERSSWRPQLQAFVPRALALRFRFQAMKGQPAYMEDRHLIDAARELGIKVPIPGGGTWPDTGTAKP